MQQRLQIFDPLLDALAQVGVVDAVAVGVGFEDAGVGGNVYFVFDGFLGGDKRAEGDEDQGVGAVNEGVSGDARFVLVGFGKSAINDEQPSSRFDRAFAFVDFDGDVAVDNVGAGGVETERFEDTAGGFGLVAEGVVGVFRFFVGGGVFDEIAFKRGHFPFAEQWGIRAAPQIPEHVQAALFFGVVLAGEVAFADDFFDVVHKFHWANLLFTDNVGAEGAVGVHGDTAMIEQVGVVDQVHAAFGKQETGVFLQAFAVGEGAFQAVHHVLFAGGEGIRIGGVNGGKMGVPQGVGLAADGDRARGVIHFVEQ